MKKKIGKAPTCKHCGGAMIDRFDELTCVMCGRISSHSCENCLKLEEERPASAKRGGKRASAA